jgi:hypothetical protein
MAKTTPNFDGDLDFMAVFERCFDVGCGHWHAGVRRPWTWGQLAYQIDTQYAPDSFRRSARNWRETGRGPQSDHLQRIITIFSKGESEELQLLIAQKLFDAWKRECRGRAPRNPIVPLRPSVAFRHHQIIIQGPNGPMLFDISSRITALITASFWQENNGFYRRNIETEKALYGGEASAVNMLSRGGLSIVVEELIADLSHASGGKSAPERFVCTNTTIEALGIRSWVEEAALRRLVDGTASAMKMSTKLECWRVFLLRNPLALTESDKLVYLYAIMEENRKIGIRPVLTCYNYLPTNFSNAFSDFYCIPGKKVFVSTTPYYMLSKFSMPNSYDRCIVDYFTELSEHLIYSANNNNCESCRYWPGGTMGDLRECVEQLSAGGPSRV